MKTLICYIEIEFNMVYFHWFCLEHDTSFSNHHIELIVALSLTNARKILEVFPP